VTPQERVLDPEARLQHARDVAYRYLGYRARTVAEVQRHLETKRVEPDTIREVIDELAEQGYLDDEKFAQQFAEDKRLLESWGADRIERELRRRGLGGEQVSAAVEAQDHDSELEAAVGVLRRKFAVPPEHPRDLDRALRTLVRKGYDLELAHDALRRYARVALEG
jgi:regulatory protein